MAQMPDLQRARITLFTAPKKPIVTWISISNVREYADWATEGRSIKRLSCRLYKTSLQLQKICEGSPSSRILTLSKVQPELQLNRLDLKIFMC